MNNRLYSIQEAASILGVSTKTLRRWDQRGRLVATRTAGNQRRYTHEQIQELKVESGKLKNNSQLSTLNSQLSTSLPSVLSGLPSGSFLKNHFLLKHKEEIEFEESSEESSEPASPAKAGLNPVKMGFVVGMLVLFLSFAGAVILVKYNVVAGLSEKRDQFAKFINNLPQISFEIRDPSQNSGQARELGFVPPDLVGSVLAAAAGGADIALNVNIPAFFSQNVGIGTATPDTSAILDLVSEDKGFLAPRMTEVQLEAITTPAAGLFVYNTDTNHYNMYNGTSWVGVFTAIGDSTTGEAFTETGTSGTALYFFDADGRGQLTIANLTGARKYTLPDAEGEISLLGQTISNAELVNSKVTVSPGTNMTGGGEVALGSSVTITLKDSVALAGTLTVSGATTLSGDLAVNGADITTTATTFNLVNATATTLNIGGAATTVSIGAATGTVTLNNATTAITGALTANGNVTLGDAITDTITFTGRVAQDSDLIPIGTTGTNDLGSSSLPWDNIYADNVFAASSGTSGYWQRNSSALSPTNITDDVLIGATATSSALIKLTGTNVAGANNSWFNAGNVGIGDTSPDYLLELSDATNTPAFALSDDDIAHGVTDVVQTDVFAHLSSISSTVGGAYLQGLADASGVALQFRGIQSSDPTDTTPAISVIGAKASGTGVQDLAAAETVFQVANNDDTAALTILGSGNIGIATTTPATFKLEIAGIIGPSVGSTYDIGSSARRFATIYADTGNFTNIAGVITGGSTTSADWLINSDNTTEDAQDATLTFERGTPATNSQFRWDSTTKQLSTNTPSFAILPDSTIAYSGTSALMVNQIQAQDIFTASASGTTRFTIENDGDTVIAGDLAVNGGDITTTETTFNLVNATATTLNIGGAATTALNIGNGNTAYTAINIGSGTGGNTINIAGTGATGADTVNIATGGTSADTVNIGSSASTTAVNVTTGTGAQTYTSNVATGATTTSGFVFDATAITSGTGIYAVTDSVTTGRLLDIATSGNTWTGNGTTNGLINIASTSTAGTASSQSILLNLARSGANANTAHTAYGVYSAVTNTNATSGTNIAGYFSASGATTANYGLIVANGNVGIGDTTPAALFVVGDGDDFQIDSTGDITLNQTTPNIAIGNTGTLTVTDGTNILFSIADDTAEGDVTVTGDLAVNGATSADITTTTTTASLFNATATTLNIGGAATTIGVGAAASATTWTGQSFSLTGANSTNNTTLTVQNTSNTVATSENAIVDIAVGGVNTTGDPQLRLTVPGGTSWYMGVDNSLNDDLFIGDGTTVGGGHRIRITSQSNNHGWNFIPSVRTTNSANMPSHHNIAISGRTLTINDQVGVTGLMAGFSSGSNTINQSSSLAVTVDKYTGVQSTGATAGTNVSITHSSAFRALTGGAAVNASGYYAEAQTAGTTGNYQALFAVSTGASPALADHVGINAKDFGVGDTRLYIQAEAGSYIALGNDRLTFEAATAYFQVSAADELTLTATALSPSTNDGNALGTTTLGWSDLHLATGGVINWANGEVTITETDADTLTIAGTTLIDVAAGILELNNAARFDTGVATVATAYSVGRNADDGTNLLQLNVPTGASFELSVNDVAQMTLSATAVDFQDNSITTTGGGSLTGTWTDLGSVTTIDINGGTIDGVTIGGAAAGAITGTTIDATTDFTIGGTVITDGAITDTGVFVITPTSAISLGSGEAGTTAATGMTLRAPDITTGGLGNIAGADLILAAGLGTGTGDAGIIDFQLPIVAGAGDFIQTRASRLVMDMAGSSTDLTFAFQQATTISTTAGDLTLNPAANVLIGNTKNLLPATSDGSQLGSGTLMWSDLFLASGAVINFNNGNVTMTHSAGILTLNDTKLDVGVSGALRFGSANNAITQSGGTVTFTAGGVSRLTMRGTDGFVEVLSRTEGSLTAELRHFLINTRNLTFNEATALATFRKVSIAQDTLVGSGAGVGETITDAATFYIAGAPVASGDMTIANPYALWVDAGTARFDDALILGADGTAPAGTNVYAVRDNTGDLTLNALTGKTINLAINGTDVAQMSATTLAFQQATTVSTTTGNLTLYAATDADVLIGDGAALLNVDGGVPGIFFNGNYVEQTNSGYVTSGQIYLGSTWGRTFTGSGSVDPAQFRITGAMTVTATKSGYGLLLQPGLTEAGSGNHALLANLYVDQVTPVVGNATVTDTASLYIANAMSATVTGANYALWVDAGTARFDDALILGADGTAPAGTNVYAVRDNTGDLTLNALTGKTINLAINGTDVAQMSATTLAFQQATTISTTTGDLTINSAGQVIFPDDDVVNLGTSQDIAMVLNSAGVAANTTLTDVLIGTPVTAVSPANSLLTSNITVSGDMAWYLNDGAGNSWEYLRFDGSADLTVFNEAGSDIDFRIEGVGAANAFFVQGSNGNVGIGTATPLLRLDVAGSARATGTATSVLTGSIDATASTAVVGVGTLFTTELVVGDRITLNDGVNPAETRTVTAITNNLNLTVSTAFTDLGNDTTPDKLAAEFIVRDSSNNVDFIVQDLGNVGIGTEAPNTKLDVRGTHLHVHSGTDVLAGNAFNFILSNSDTTPFGTDASGMALRNSDSTTDNNYFYLSFQGDNTNGGRFHGAGLAVIFKSHSLTDYSTDLALYTHATGTAAKPLERMRITSTGNIGIGTTAPDAALEINHATGDSLRLTYNDADGSAVNYTDFSLDADGTMTVLSSAKSIASGTDSGIIFDSGDLTITGASTSWLQNQFLKADVTAATALTIDNAATVYINDAPDDIGAGPATITNKYALWVDAGNVQFDGGLTVDGDTLIGAAYTGDANRLTVSEDTLTTTSEANAIMALQGNTDKLIVFHEDGVLEGAIGYKHADSSLYSVLIYPPNSGSALPSYIARFNRTDAQTVDSNAASITFAPVLREAASGTHAIFDGILVNALSVTAGVAGVTEASTMRIAGASNASGATNYALWVDAGTSRFDGAVTYGSQVTFTDSDATPDVSAGSHFITNTTTFTITDFDAGAGTLQAGHIIYVESNGAITYDCTPFANLNCGGADIVTAAKDITSWIYDGTDWTLINWMDTSVNQTGADIAELFPSQEQLEPGDVVVADTGYPVNVRKSATVYEKQLLGIVSTQPAITLGQGIEGNNYPVALTGRVPVKVSLENGPIAIGDPITSSSTPGVGMKSTKAGRVIGIALEQFNNETIGTILAFVNPHWQGTDKLLALDGNDRLGIGTTTPSFKLDIQDMQIATAAAQIFNTDTGTSSAALVLKLGNTSADAVASTNHFISFETAGIGIVGSISGNGAKGVTYATSGVADFAEYFRKDPNENIPFGSIVCMKEDGLVTSCEILKQVQDDTRKDKILGIASEAPAFLGGINLGASSIAVGLVGQVETFVSSVNGDIKPGDPLTLGSTPGVAVKAIKAGQIIGKAVEAFPEDGRQSTEDGTQKTEGTDTDNPSSVISNPSSVVRPLSSAIGKILVSVNVGWYDPSIYIASDGTLGGVQNTQNTQQAGESDISDSQTIGSTDLPSVSSSLENDSLFKELKDKVGSLESKLDLLSLQFEQQASTSGLLAQIGEGQVLAASDSASLVQSLGDVELNNATISEDLMVLGRATVTSLGVTGNINAGLLAIHGIDGEINTLSGDLYLQKDSLGGINIFDGRIVMDTKGNMTVAGTITAKQIEAENYTILGEESIGSSTIPAGSTSIEVTTQVASSSSKIFLSATSLTDKQITVVEKSDGKFKVAIPQPTASPISFDWWIVGNRN